MTTVFFMIVTPVDLGIARYCLAALLRASARIADSRVVVYGNGLSAEQADKLRALSSRFPATVEVRDNADRLVGDLDSIEPGQWYTTDSGHRELREGRYESCGEVWSREPVLLDADLVVLVDADFEVFSSEYLSVMLGAFEVDEKLGFYSTDFRPRQQVFETYSGEYAVVADLYATWCCVYRRAALEKSHQFGYVEVREEGELPLMYDHSAKLQQSLVEEFGYTGRLLERSYHWQFLHYGAFAKNRSLSGAKLAFYRFLRVGGHNGWRHVVRAKAVALVLRTCARAGWKILGMRRYDAERARYLFDE